MGKWWTLVTSSAIRKVFHVHPALLIFYFFFNLYSKEQITRYSLIFNVVICHEIIIFKINKKPRCENLETGSNFKNFREWI